MGDGSGSLRASNQTTLTGKKMPLPVVMALYRAGFAEPRPEEAVLTLALMYYQAMKHCRMTKSEV